MVSKEVMKTEQTLEQHLAELEARLAELEDNNKKLSAIFNHSNDAIYVIDFDEPRIVDANPKAVELLGYPHDELLQLSLSQLFPGQGKVLAEFARSVIDSGSGWTNELTCLTKDQRTLYVEISASIAEIGDRRCVIAMLRDVTGHKKRDEQLHLMATFAELNPAPVARLNQDGVVVQANPAARTFFDDLDLVTLQPRRIP